ncbi:hypothetical protein LXJ15735_27850 [Lacrimispora xylanolytica]
MKGYIFNGERIEIVDVPQNKIGTFYKDKYVAESEEELKEYYINEYDRFIQDARLQCEFDEVDRLKELLNKVLTAIDNK